MQIITNKNRIFIKQGKALLFLHLKGKNVILLCYAIYLYNNCPLCPAHPYIHPHRQN